MCDSTDAVVGLRPTTTNRMVLFTIDQQMRSNDLRVMKFLCADHFPHGELEKIVRPMDLFQLMISKCKINIEAGDVQYLAELLYFVHRLDLIKKLGYTPQEVRNFIKNNKHHRVPDYRIMLVKLYDDLVQKEVDTLKFLISGSIGRKAAESAKDALDLFREMEQAGVLGHEDLVELEQMSQHLERRDLAETIAVYKRNCLPLSAAIQPPPQEPPNPPLPNMKQIAQRGFAEKLVVMMPEPSNTPQGPTTPQNSYRPPGRGQVPPGGNIATKPSSGNPAKISNKASEESVQVGDTSMETGASGGGVPSVVDLISTLRDGSDDDDDDDDNDDNDKNGDEGNDSSFGGNDIEAIPLPAVSAAMEQERPEVEQVDYQQEMLTRQLQQKERELQEMSRKVQIYEEEKLRMEREQALPIHDCYEMSRNPRGMCVIINNENFEGFADPTSIDSNLKDRRGTDVDAAKLQDTFTALHFNVVLYRNLTHLEMVQLLMHFAMNIDHKDFDCFVCCILTHGQIGQVFGVDGLPVKITDLTGCFRPIACPSLKGKPKLFFVQACQGEDRQRIVPLDIETDEPAAPLEVPQTIPNEADFLIGYATVPGFVSYRSQSRGSWYISALTEHLNTFARRYDLMSILTLVNKDIASGKAKLNLEPIPYGQVPAPLHTLRKKVIFREPVVSCVLQETAEHDSRVRQTEVENVSRVRQTTVENVSHVQQTTTE